MSPIALQIPMQAKSMEPKKIATSATQNICGSHPLKRGHNHTEQHQMKVNVRFLNTRYTILYMLAFLFEHITDVTYFEFEI